MGNHMNHRRMRERMGEPAGYGRGRSGHWGPPHRRGGRRRRGEIRTELLATLAEAPGHGYEVMQTLEERSGGAWRPSPGSVYPTLQQLQDEGLVTSREQDGKRIYEITDAGRAESERRTAEAGGSPWDDERDRSTYGQLRDGVVGIHQAARQLARHGNDTQLQRAVEIVRDARKRLYQLLAEG